MLLDKDINHKILMSNHFFIKGKVFKKNLKKTLKNTIIPINNYFREFRFHKVRLN